MLDQELTDLIRQRLVVLGQAVKDVFLAGAVQIVHHIRHKVYSAHLYIAGCHQAGELLLHLRLDDFYRSGGGTLHIGHILNHPDLPLVIQLLDHGC